MKNYVKVVFDRRKTIEKKGCGLVELHIYASRDCRKYLPLNEMTQEEWAAFSVSPALQTQVDYYNNIVQAMYTLGDPITLESLNKRLGIDNPAPEVVAKETAKQKRAKATAFIDFFHDELASERIDIRTRRARNVVFNSLLSYGQIKSFEDLTPANILDYDKWLRADHERTDVTIKSYHKRLHRYVIKAYEYGYIERDPYKAVSIPTGRSAERRPLSEDEIDKLRSLQLRGKEEKARDLFVFSAFTGLAYCDAQAFEFGTMTEKIGDLYYIDGSRIKTGTNFFTPILPPAMEVLRMYNYRLPRLSNQKYNDFLHLIEARLQLNKPLTTHLARHTFATLVLSQDVPIENLARMLGHKDVRTTQVYAKILKKTITRHAENLSKYFV